MGTTSRMWGRRPRPISDHSTVCMTSSSHRKYIVQPSLAGILPSELLLDIFNCATVSGDQRTLAAAARVCSSWAAPAQTQLYCHVKLSSSESASSFLTTLETSSLGELVMAVDIPSMTLPGYKLLWQPSQARRSAFKQLWRRSTPGQRVCEDRFLNAVLKKCPKLKALSLGSIAIDVAPKQIDAPPHATNIVSDIRYLRIQNSASQQMHWLAFAILCGSIELGSLEKLVWQGDGQAAFIARPSLSQNELRHLQKLVFVGSNSEPSGSIFYAILSVCPITLSELIFDRVGLGLPVEGSHPMTRLTHLRRLSVGYSNFDGDILRTVLHRNSHSLEIFEIRGRPRGAASYTGPGVHLFQRLRSVRISQWDYNDSQPLDLCLISAAAHTIRDLHMPWPFRIGLKPLVLEEEFASALLAVAPSLESLTIAATLHSSRFSILVTVFVSMTSLYTLRIKLPSARLYPRFVQQLPASLQELHLDMNLWFDFKTYEAVLPLFQSSPQLNEKGTQPVPEEREEGPQIHVPQLRTLRITENKGSNSPSGAVADDREQALVSLRSKCIARKIALVLESQANERPWYEADL